jgi:hypothetical protein
MTAISLIIIAHLKSFFSKNFSHAYLFSYRKQ